MAVKSVGLHIQVRARLSNISFVLISFAVPEISTPVDGHDEEEGEEEEGDAIHISQMRPEEEGEDEVPHSANSENRLPPEDYDDVSPSKTVLV